MPQALRALNSTSSDASTDCVFSTLTTTSFGLFENPLGTVTIGPGTKPITPETGATVLPARERGWNYSPIERDSTEIVNRGEWLQWLPQRARVV